MSLRSVAIYYDVHNKELYRYHINVGWSLYKQVWVDCVIDLPKICNTHIVQIYEIKVPAKWVGNNRYESLLNKLFQEVYEACDRDITGIEYFNKVYGKDWYIAHKIK